MDSGWYDDPGAQDLLRWWDGSAWTGLTKPRPVPPQGAISSALLTSGATPVDQPVTQPAIHPATAPVDQSAQPATSFDRAAPTPDSGQAEELRSLLTARTTSSGPSPTPPADTKIPRPTPEKRLRRPSLFKIAIAVVALVLYVFPDLSSTPASPPPTLTRETPVYLEFLSASEAPLVGTGIASSGSLAEFVFDNASGKHLWDVYATAKATDKNGVVRVAQTYIWHVAPGERFGGVAVFDLAVDTSSHVDASLSAYAGPYPLDGASDWMAGVEKRVDGLALSADSTAVSAALVLNGAPSGATAVVRVWALSPDGTLTSVAEALYAKPGSLSLQLHTDVDPTASLFATVGLNLL